MLNMLNVYVKDLKRASISYTIYVPRPRYTPTSLDIVHVVIYSGSMKYHNTISE